MYSIFAIKISYSSTTLYSRSRLRSVTGKSLKFLDFQIVVQLVWSSSGYSRSQVTKSEQFLGNIIGHSIYLIICVVGRVREEEEVDDGVLHLEERRRLALEPIA